MFTVNNNFLYCTIKVVGNTTKNSLLTTDNWQLANVSEKYEILLKGKFHKLLYIVLR